MKNLFFIFLVGNRNGNKSFDLIDLGLSNFGGYLTLINKIITEFYPSVSKQVILFPLLHKELTAKELDIMKPFVNSAFVLRNDNSYSFIQEVDINDLMKE